jgi:hypothetical protein
MASFTSITETRRKLKAKKTLKKRNKDARKKAAKNETAKILKSLGKAKK